jgi:hypothetical protein
VDASSLVVMGVIFLATLIRSTFGFGEALVAVPLLALLVPVEVAAPLAVLFSITVAGIVVVQDWHQIHLQSAWRLVLSTLFGIPLGLLLLTTVPERVVKAGLALVIIAFSTYCLSRGRRLELKSDRSAWVFGFGAGVLGGAYGKRAAARGLRRTSSLVSGAVPGDSSGLFSAGQLGGDVRLLAHRAVGARCNPILSAVLGPCRRCNRPGPSAQSTSQWSPVYPLRPWRSAAGRGGVVDPVVVVIGR